MTTSQLQDRADTTVAEARDVDIVAQRIADAIESQRRRALVEYAIAELVWHSPEMKRPAPCLGTGR